VHGHNPHIHLLSRFEFKLLRSLNNVQVSSLSQFIDKIGLVCDRSDSNGLTGSLLRQDNHYIIAINDNLYDRHDK
jgi:hypothetical protein